MAWPAASVTATEIASLVVSRAYEPPAGWAVRPGAIEKLALVPTALATSPTAATVTLVVPSRVPLDAVTVNGPPRAAPAVNSPPVEIVPPPLTLQANAGCGYSGWPN